MIIKLIFIAFILSYIVNIFGFKEKNVLACGLTGYCGANPANLDKVKIIALFNESRGKHSCGVFSGGKLLKGAEENKQALITDWLIQNQIPQVKNWNTIIIHTRAATQGAKTMANAHPFYYEKGKRKGWFAHNGTLKDWRSLGKKYKLDASKFDVDSKFLGNAIFNGDLQILNEYSGAAAFLFADNINKNTLYVWKGAAGDKEERPLYYYKDIKNQGMYISSMLEPLYIIADNSEHIYKFDANTLNKIENGVIVEKTVYERDETLHENYVVPFHNHKNHNSSYPQTTSNVGPIRLKAIDWNKTFTSKAFKFLSTNSAPENYLFYQKFRFYSNIRDTRKTLKPTFAHGVYKATEDGYIASIDGKVINEVDETKDPLTEYYFFKGYMINSKKNLNFLMSLLKVGNGTVFYTDLINMTDFPFPLPGKFSGSGGELNTVTSEHVYMVDYSNHWVNLECGDLIQVPFEENGISLSFNGRSLEDIFFWTDEEEDIKNNSPLLIINSRIQFELEAWSTKWLKEGFIISIDTKKGEYEVLDDYNVRHFLSWDDESISVIPNQIRLPIPTQASGFDTPVRESQNTTSQEEEEDDDVEDPLVTYDDIITTTKDFLEGLSVLVDDANEHMLGNESVPVKLPNLIDDLAGPITELEEIIKKAEQNENSNAG